MELKTLVESYGGWVALVIYFLFNKLWPLIENKIVPDKISAREFEQRMEERRQDTNDKIAAALQQYAIGMTTINERIATLLTNQITIITKQDTLFGITSQAISDMKARTGTDRRVTDTGPLSNKKGD